MLQDPFAFLSSNSGDQRFEPFQGLSSILFGFAAGSGLVEKHMLRPSAQLKLRAAARKLSPGTVDRVRYPNIHSFEDLAEQIDAGRLTLNDYTSSTTRIERKQAIRSASKSVFKPYRAIGGFLKSASIAIGVTTLFSLGMDMFTPGVNKLAAAGNDKFINESLTIDSNAAFTQRQRALQAIFDSQSSLRNVIGNEAAYLHR